MDKPRPPHMGKDYFRHPPEEFITDYGTVISEQQIWSDDVINLPQDKDYIVVFEERDETEGFGHQKIRYYAITKTKPSKIKNPNYEIEITQYKIDKAAHDKAYDDYELALQAWNTEQRRLQYEVLKKEFE
jgi:hypothetical protein